MHPMNDRNQTPAPPVNPLDDDGTGDFTPDSGDELETLTEQIEALATVDAAAAADTAIDIADRLAGQLEEGDR